MKMKDKSAEQIEAKKEPDLARNDQLLNLMTGL